MTTPFIIICTGGDFYVIVLFEESISALSCCAPFSKLTICSCNLILKSDGCDGKLQVILRHSVNLRDQLMIVVLLNNTFRKSFLTVSVKYFIQLCLPEGMKAIIKHIQEFW